MNSTLSSSNSIFYSPTALTKNSTTVLNFTSLKSVEYTLYILSNFLLYCWNDSNNIWSNFYILLLMSSCWSPVEFRDTLEKEVFLALVIMCSSLFSIICNKNPVTVFGHYHIHLGIVMNIEYISQFIVLW